MAFLNPFVVCFAGVFPEQDAVLSFDPRQTKVLQAALRHCTAYFAAAMLFSMAINTLYLAPTVFMIQLSDRVMSSGSKETLLLLLIAYAIAIICLGALDYVRAQVLIRAGLRLDKLLSRRLIGLLFERANIFGAPQGQRDEPLRALDTFRHFVTGSGIHAFFDLPWLPIYLAVLFLVHPYLGGVALAFMALQVGIAILSRHLTDERVLLAGQAGQKSFGLAEAALRNSEVVQGMGMMDAVLAPWEQNRRVMLIHQAVASDRNAMVQATSTFLRLFVQSALVSVGAYLAIDRVITPGGMFAAMLLIGRATQPLDQVVGVWKTALMARQAYQNLNFLFSQPPLRETSAVLPQPTGRLTLERVVYAPYGARRPVIQGVGFNIEPGTCLAVIGPSASGKSTLARLIVGIYPPSDGAVRLDGASIFHWDRGDFGRHVGYLPQDIELFAGTVAENIARFQGANDGQAIIQAAQRAGAHEMILTLPKGYETSIGEAGAILSGGQRQLIGLARAVYGAPRLVVLDEPNSNLDNDGEVALTRCLINLKKAGTTVVLVSHRPSILNHVDLVLYMAEGQARALLPRDEFLAKLKNG